MKLIINADDFGLSKSITDEIIDGIKAGVITSTTIMANMEWADYAIKQALKNDIRCVGLHITLTIGKSLTKSKSLCDNQGKFYHWKEQFENKKIDKKELYNEIIAQKDFVESRGIKITHIDWHHHLQSSQILTDTIIKIAKKLNLPMRNAGLDEQKFIIKPDILCQEFFGETATKETIKKLINKYKNTKDIVEIMSHSGYMDNYTESITSYKLREKELKTLLECKKEGLFNDIEMIDFADLAKMEFLDVFNMNSKHIGIMERSKAHRENAGAYHRAVHIWFINNKNEVLVQKRAAIKKQHPNEWDIPSAGHVNAGEDLLTACQRETFEELGIKVPKDKFLFQCELLNQKGWEFSEQYIVRDNTKIKDMLLDAKEVSEVKWLSLNNFKKLLYSTEFVSHREEYKNTIFNFIKLAIEKK